MQGDLGEEGERGRRGEQGGISCVGKGKGIKLCNKGKEGAREDG